MRGPSNRVRPSALKVLLSLVAAGIASLIVRRLINWGTQWGATAGELGLELPGDDYLDGGDHMRTAMTRAVTIAAPPADVWPWLAQLGRGAGWYSFDLLDNGGVASAEHIVSWIPAPRVGDAAAIGWIRQIDPGRSLTWWLPGTTAFGSTMRMVIDMRLDEAGAGSRLVIRVSGDGSGPAGAIAVRLFEVVDSIMAIRQLYGIRVRAEQFGARTLDPHRPETGERSQYQLYETIWASGDRAGIRGREHARRWRRSAQSAGVIEPADEDA